MPDRGLTRRGFVKDIVRFPVAVKVEFCSCWRSVWLDSNIINVFFAVKGCTVGHISSGIIGNHSDVIADLGLVWITDEGIKGSSYRHVCRPSSTSVTAIRVEKLRISIVGRVTGIVPDHIDAPIGSDSYGAEPMPFVGIDRIVADPTRRTEGCSSVGAANKHHLAASSRAGQ